MADTGNTEGAHNTPADGSWSLTIHFTQGEDTTSKTIRIVYLPTGDIDFLNTIPGDLMMANTIMKPVIDLAQVISAFTGISLDVWRIINWIFVSSYWIVLGDLGRITPTTYTPLPDHPYYRDNFTTARRHTATNNIFVNDTLYRIYSNLLLNSILPALNLSAPPGGIAPLNESNILANQDTVFRRSYSCTVRKWKAPLTALVSILVAQYALIRGAYSLFIVIAAWYQKRKSFYGEISGFQD